jgi:hypothetical protein
MTAGTYDITIEQGATYSQVFTWKDANRASINLTGYTARMQARESVDTASTFIALTTENSGIALGGAAGTITLAMTAAATSSLTVFSGFYDLELISGSGIVTRLLQGSLTVSPEVTR